jgi:hypothetical protein
MQALLSLPRTGIAVASVGTSAATAGAPLAAR